MIVLCYICPPLAVLLMGKPFNAVLNVFLTALLFWVPGIKHALFCYADWAADKKFGRVVDAINHPSHVRAGGGAGTFVTNNYYGANNSEAQPVNSPHIGENGTVFRRKS